MSIECEFIAESLKATKQIDGTTPWLTIFTPTYNRRDTLGRVYESLKKIKLPTDSEGNPVEFEWLIIDDGSNDNTVELLRKWCDENILPIRAYREQNGGKHVATNNATERAKGFMMTILDSDDTFLPNVLEVWHKHWEALSDDTKASCKGVTARSIDPETGKMIGTPLPESPTIVNCQDLRFKLKVKGEMSGCIRVDVMKEFPFPELDSKMRYCPESIVWLEMGKNYAECVVDECVRHYYHDAGNALTKGQHVNRSAENYHLWSYEVNNMFDKYVLASPVAMFKAIVGMSMDGKRTNRKFGQIMDDIAAKRHKLLVALFSPVGFFLARR